jgi:hypothetical protein
LPDWLTDVLIQPTAEQRHHHHVDTGHLAPAYVPAPPHAYPAPASSIGFISAQDHFVASARYSSATPPLASSDSGPSSSTPAPPAQFFPPPPNFDSSSAVVWDSEFPAPYSRRALYEPSSAVPPILNDAYQAQLRALAHPASPELLGRDRWTAFDAQIQDVEDVLSSDKRGRVVHPLANSQTVLLRPRPVHAFASKIPSSEFVQRSPVALSNWPTSPGPFIVASPPPSGYFQLVRVFQYCFFLKCKS